MRSRPCWVIRSHSLGHGFVLKTSAQQAPTSTPSTHSLCGPRRQAEPVRQQPSVVTTGESDKVSDRCLVNTSSSFCSFLCVSNLGFPPWPQGNLRVCLGPTPLSASGPVITGDCFACHLHSSSFYWSQCPRATHTARSQEAGPSLPNPWPLPQQHVESSRPGLPREHAPS